MKKNNHNKILTPILPLLHPSIYALVNLLHVSSLKPIKIWFLSLWLCQDYFAAFNPEGYSSCMLLF